MDHEAFEQPLPVCDLTKCRATCCHDGVILSEEEADILSKLGGGEGIELMQNGRNKTRTVPAGSDQVALDFPAHFQKTRCVFLDDQHRCSWQLKAVEEKKHPWYYKPSSCWLHPLLISRKDGRPFLTLLSRANDDQAFATHTPCGKYQQGAPPARESLAMELRMLGDLSGRDFYGELNAPSGFSSRANENTSG